ncbi:MAG: adenylate/guanylate cyclase domain-containing protein [Candidatus Promineifilaceae bacterium]|nr:adenylate/guanylate cyclase domain-containing protein [Candidatus Promineifilaceae bacterium]
MQPTGTVTFLFTDIEGSTRLWDRHPHAMQQAQARHDTILHQAIREHQGTVVKSTGDGLHVVFPAAADALRAALTAQQALAAEAWPDSAHLQVRMGLHSGEAELREGDYYGAAVNRAARLMGLASGGQVLVSSATAELIRDRLPTGVSLTDLGRQRLPDLARPEHVFQLVHPSLPADFPPLPSASAGPHNLPERLTSFVGRQRELEEIGRLLTDEGVRERLVTLTGPGGTGKTRLALETAGALLGQFPDGIWLIELAPLADPQQVAAAVAEPLGLSEQPGGRPLPVKLADHLQRQRVLLILDNCEHLIEACARLADTLLRACPQLRILASSREALGIAGERAYRVSSLTLPPAENGQTPDELKDFEAVRLFVERARAVKPDFNLRRDNAAAVGQICQRLDGIPLALELAAARVRVLATGQIAARLDDRFRLLTGGSRTALPRQRTLQALIDWSYDLLSDAECVLLRRLAVFSGGWTLDIAEEVVGFEPLEAYEVLDLLEQLVNKSLVVILPTAAGRRYGMLETIRQYAQEKLAESDEAVVVRRRHMIYFRDLNYAVFREVHDLRGDEHFRRLIGERDNLRTASAFALEHDLETALAGAGQSTTRHTVITPPAEALNYVEQALALAESRPDFSGPEAQPERIRLLAGAYAAAAGAAAGVGLNHRSESYAQRGLALAQQLGDAEVEALLRWQLMLSNVFLGNAEETERQRQLAIALADQANSDYFRAIGLVSELLSPAAAADPEQARASWEAGLAMFQQGADAWGLATAHQAMALVLVMAGQLEKARNHAQRAVRYYHEYGESNISNGASTLLAEVDRARGELDAAARRYRKIAQSWRDFGHFGALARCLECLAFIDQARVAAEPASDDPSRLQHAATLLSVSAAIRRRHDSTRQPREQVEFDRGVAAIKGQLDTDLFAGAWQQGQTLDVDQALALALDPANNLS